MKKLLLIFALLFTCVVVNAQANHPDNPDDAEDINKTLEQREYPLTVVSKMENPPRVVIVDSSGDRMIIYGDNIYHNVAVTTKIYDFLTLFHCITSESYTVKNHFK